MRPFRSPPQKTYGLLVSKPSGFDTGGLAAGVKCQSLSFSPLAAVNDTFFEAAIVIASPVAGLRP